MKPRGSDLQAVGTFHNNENNMITSGILDDGALSGDFSFVANKHKPTTRAPPPPIRRVKKSSSVTDPKMRNGDSDHVTCPAVVVR